MNRVEKVLFLDIDGVLNNSKFIKNKPDYKAQDLDPENIRCLNKILERTGTSIVISSTWRLAYPMSQLVTILESQGLKPGRIIGKTPHLIESQFRSKEIEAWADCQLYHPHSILILDDDDQFEERFRSYFLQTSMVSGLTEDLVEKAVSILNFNNFEGYLTKCNVLCNRSVSSFG